MSEVHLDLGRDAFKRRNWREAFTELTAAEAEAPLAPTDYELLVVTELLLNTNPSGAEIWERAHHELLARGDVERAVRCAFFLGMGFADAGEPARGAGWIARGGRLLDEAQLDCAARGYLLIPTAIQALMAGDVGAAIAIHEQMIHIGERFKDRDLITIARHGLGRTRLHAGQFAEGLAIIDDVMVAIGSEELSPLIIGIIYCSVIEGLHEIYDVGRAREWTMAMQRWYDAQSDLAIYRGRCMIFRAEVLELGGEWRGALQESLQACNRFLGPPPHPAAGEAFYRQAEMHRLRGELAGAEDAYTRAGEFGRNPYPGLALLRLAQGRTDSAEAAIRRVLGETQDPLGRAGILPAVVEIMLATGQIQTARDAAAELKEIATEMSSEYLAAAASQAMGAALLGAGEPQAALTELREAAKSWRQMEAPHRAAGVRLLIGAACRELGDEDGAVLEIESAREAFEQLGALPDLARIEKLNPAPVHAAGGLTGREIELLALVATGKTNREIAADLVISERTVARHVSNIFNKLGVSSRSAATAYAFKHDLV
jgi:DNA-binding CsgD family transcriptional regulator/predicted negative regulator of RcsB-dependent stress response